MPNTIAQNLARLVAARTAIADAITAKGGTVNQGDGLEEFPADIATIPSGGGGSADMSDVNFYDHDGTVVDSYTASEFAALTTMPDNPSHEGLTAQGWNWSLADAKAYVAKYGKLNIGQMYKTDDGALRLYICLNEGRLSPVLGLCPNGTLTVDWGDGSATETMTGSSISTLVYLGHTYATVGDYVISVLPSAGSKIGFGSRNGVSAILCKSQTDTAVDRRVYLNTLYKIELPDSVTYIGEHAFEVCYSLSLITIPRSVKSILSYAFQTCYSLSSIIIPDLITTIQNNTFDQCFSLSSVTIPDSVKSISGSAFSQCSSLVSVTIPNSVTSIGDNIFYQCFSLSSVTIPDSVKSISNFLVYQCSSLSSVTIPGSVATIYNSSLAGCYSLSSITIPDNVTSIGSSAFKYCYGLGFIKFTSTTPPTVSSSNAWTGVPTDCIIYVPTGYLETYKGSANYPNPSTYQYVEY